MLTRQQFERQVRALWEGQLGVRERDPLGARTARCIEELRRCGHLPSTAAEILATASQGRKQSGA